MADDEWQLEAVHEQFNVFNKLKKPHEIIPTYDNRRLYREIVKIKNDHLQKEPPTTDPIQIIEEIMKYSDGDNINLAFVVIVTNVEVNGSLRKMLIFVIMSGGKRKFIDMNLTLFHSWEAFLQKNDLPPCQYCFPVDGRYSVGGKLKINFACSPSATRKNVNIVWKSLGFVVGVGIVAASYFFKIPPIKNPKIGSLLDIAKDFMPGIREYFGYILCGVTLVQKLKNKELNIIEAIPEIWKLMQTLQDKFRDEISWILKKVQATLRNLYHWIRKKVSSFFEAASEAAQHMFVAMTRRVDSEIIAVEREVGELLKASQRNNFQPQTVAVSAAIHAKTRMGDSGYADTIFKNAINDSALHHGVKNKDDETLHYVTSDLLEICDRLATKLGKPSLNDVQDIFEALSDVVKEEFKNKMETYTNMLTAAKAGAGHQINVKAFNLTLGIQEDPKEYYWKEAMRSALATRLSKEKIQDRIKDLKEQKKILIIELVKNDENAVSGVYRCVGIHGEGKFTTTDFIQALKDIQVNLNEEMLVINETSSMMLIRDEALTITTIQELNTENTSEGLVWIEGEKEHGVNSLLMV